MNRDIIYNIFNNVDHPTECYKMASISTKFLQTYSDNRYRILHQIFINHILNNDTNLTNRLKQFKNIWMSNGATYIDEHRIYNKTCKIDKLVIVLKYGNSTNKMLNLPAWIIPTSLKFTYQTKNELDIHKDNSIHLSIVGAGATLYNEQLKDLHLNKFLVQKYMSTVEINLLLSLDEFNRIFA